MTTKQIVLSIDQQLSRERHCALSRVYRFPFSPVLNHNERKNIQCVGFDRKLEWRCVFRRGSCTRLNHSLQCNNARILDLKFSCEFVLILFIYRTRWKISSRKKKKEICWFKKPAISFKTYLNRLEHEL